MKRIISRGLLTLLLGTILLTSLPAGAGHPRIYTSGAQREAFLQRMESSEKVRATVGKIQTDLEPYVARHQADPAWIVSRLQMYWKTKYARVYVNGMDFSHGEGQAPAPTVRFSGSRDWATDYLVPALEDVLPYMDDERGLYLQNGAKEGRPWEWVHPSETGHIVERINERILNLARDAAFLFWLSGEEKYAVFATDIFMTYMEGMYHREPPLTYENHHNAKLMGLQTFEVIHERIVEPVTVGYDFLYSHLVKTGKDLDLIASVLRKWADQEIKNGVPDNNWNLMQARYLTYLALALEDDDQYADGQGQQYYLDQMLHQNSEKQKALVDVMKVFDAETGMWPETAGYSTGVCDDILEIICLIDRVQNNRLLEKYPLVEKATLGTFQYLFPNGFTVAFGDAKHSRLRFNSLELLIAQYRKYGHTEKEALITGQLKHFMEQGAYERKDFHSLFDLFLYVDELMEAPPAAGIGDLVTPTFHAPNVSWLVQRNGMDPTEGMMISQNAAEGNHSHANGINIELYAKGLVFAPDAAAGVSYWSQDHREYYSRFPAHNTVIVDGRSDHRTMMSRYAFEVQACYPEPGASTPANSPYTFADVTFAEPGTGALQRRLTATVRTGETSGYFLDIFRSALPDGGDRKHEYLFHSQGAPIALTDDHGDILETKPTKELSSSEGDLVGYDYFKEKRETAFDRDFIAQFSMPAPGDRQVGVNLWMRGYPERKIFTVMAPPSRAISKESVPDALYQQPLPTLVVRQAGEARTRPFVSIIEAFEETAGPNIEKVEHFFPRNENPGCIGLAVHSKQNRADYIFNDEDGETENTFEGQKFQGAFGIISYLGDELKTLILGKGQLLASDLWMIQSEEAGNTVVVQRQADGWQISASKAFSLTMPFPKSAGGNATLISSKDKGASEGKLFTIDGRRFALFELPATNEVWRLKL